MKRHFAPQQTPVDLVVHFRLLSESLQPGFTLMIAHPSATKRPMHLLPQKSDLSLKSESEAIPADCQQGLGNTYCATHKIMASSSSVAMFL